MKREFECTLLSLSAERVSRDSSLVYSAKLIGPKAEMCIHDPEIFDSLTKVFDLTKRWPELRVIIEVVKPWRYLPGADPEAAGDVD